MSPAAGPGRGPEPPRSGALRGVDRAALAVALAEALREAGVAAGLTGVGAFAQALGALPKLDPDGLYWAARTTLVHRHEDLAAFDALFAAVFGGAGLPRSLAGERRAPASAEAAAAPPQEPGRPGEAGAALPWATLPAPVAPSESAPAGRRLPERRASALAALAETPFDELDAEELEAVGALLAASLRRWPERRTPRRARHRAGDRVALRASLARARRSGFEPVELVRSRPRRAPRPLVLLCDVSQSMQPYATAYLHLMRAAVLEAGAEVFAFATGLTRLTPLLAHRSPSLAVARAAEAVADRFGGTRIATSIAALLASRQGNAARGAVVVVASDGWDADPPEALAAAMARLARRAHRLVWLNPRAGAPGFAPRTAGMAAALPYCDALLAAGTARSLAAAFASVAEATNA